MRNSLSGEISSLEARLVVNAAGLHAQEVATCLAGMPAQHIPRRHLARGCYFTLTGDALAWVPPALAVAQAVAHASGVHISHVQLQPGA